MSADFRINGRMDVREVARNHQNEAVIVAWLLISQAAMQLVLRGYYSDELTLLADVLQAYVPTLRRMENDVLFSVAAAKSQAALMVCLIPVVFATFFVVRGDEVFASVRKRGVEKTAVFMVFYTVIILALAFLGLNVRGPGRLFESTPAGFALLSAQFALLVGHYLRAIVAIAFGR